MNAAAWERAKSLLAEAADLPPADRARFVIEHCSDLELRREVLDMLALPAPLSVIVAADALAPGDHLGPYVIEQLLGRGGMGEVYRARDPRLGRLVAVKVLSSEVATDPARLRRFEQEAHAVAALSHPNVVAIFDVGQQPVPFLVSELLDGETLRAVLSRGPLPVQQVIDHACQLTAGLEAAHDCGIVHRDLKPENLVITRRGVVKILDFGLAKTLRPSAGASQSAADDVTAVKTLEGTMVGTVGYMAPEQVRGTASDHRADIFACGAILYEMVTGQRAFQGESPADILSAILREQPRKLDAPPALARVIRRCLAKAPVDRFQSVRDVHLALQSCDTPSLKPAVKDPVVNSIAVLPFTNMSADPENQYFGDGLAEELINALTRLPGLLVASRTSFRFGGRHGDIRAIGQALRVTTVLQGSVRRAGKRLRVTVQLINVADGYHLWSERYDREMADVFDIQDDIVDSITKSLAPALASGWRSLVKRPTNNLEAYQLYLKGRHYWHQRMPSTVQKAIRCFEQAIELDANYALAYTGLADCFAACRGFGWLSAEQAQPKALQAVTRAMSLDPSLAEVSFSRALYALWLDRNWRDAHAYLHQVLDINPQLAAAHSYIGILHALSRRGNEAMPEIDIACNLEPLSAFIHFLAAVAFNVLGWFSEAEFEARQTLELQPDALMGLWPLVIALCGLGRVSEAAVVGDRLVTISRAPVFLGILALAQGLDGRIDESRRALHELRERQTHGEYVTPVGELCVSTGLKDIDGIRASLQTCMLDKTAWLTVACTCGPWLDQLRTDPEVDRLLNQLYGPTP
jgi:serine/threonine protein kinase/tetratricopeptide (TPR) repeat protein